jgi:transcriptional regulator with XRE-family HTH domain
VVDTARPERFRHTRVWDLAVHEGLTHPSGELHLTRLAARMGVTRQHLSQVRLGRRPIRTAFIEGALRAFPGHDFNYLFPNTPTEVAS